VSLKTAAARHSRSLLVFVAWGLASVVVIINIALTRETRQLRAVVELKTNDHISSRLATIVGFTPSGVRKEVRFDGNMRYLVIAFSPDCPYCEKSVAHWKEISEHLDRQTWSVIWVSRDRVDTAGEFAVSQGISDPVLADVTYRSYIELGLASVPSTIVVAPDGNVIGSVRGQVSDLKLPNIEHLIALTPQ
jgi:peroxiredoxin